MKSLRAPFAFVLIAGLGAGSLAAQAPKSGSPADHLPPHIVQLTSFGERPDWSADGRKILFLSKTFGDALEIDVATRAIRNRTAHYPHYGYTRVLYLANGDILLAGPDVFDPKQAARARNECYLYVLDANGKKPPAPLGVRCNEGPAVSRHRLHLAWTEWTEPAPGGDNLSRSKMFEADLVYENGTPKLANQRLIIDGADLPLRCTMESQNFRPPAERELIFSGYSDAGKKCEVLGIDLETKRVTNYTESAAIYDEPEGIFPDGRFTSVECDSQHPGGNAHLDIWKLALDGSHAYTRLTFFSDFENYKASNPVISDDGRFMAFQMGRSGESAGVGHGVFMYDLAAAPIAGTP